MLLVMISVMYGGGVLLLTTLFIAKNRAAGERLFAFEDDEQMRAVRRGSRADRNEVIKTIH